MGDTTINYEELGFGFHTFKKEICAELGEDFWNKLVKNIELPDMNSESGCQCHNMYLFIERFKELTDEETLKKILCKVRHGLHPSQCAEAHKRFMEIGDLDEYLGDSEDRVIRSVLSGDLTCEYEIDIPDDIMQEYVVADQIIASNYFNYYKVFARSGIIDLHEGSVSWIIPHKGEKGPSLAFRIHFNEENAENELKALIQGIQKGEVPQMWIVTPDATPDNIIDIMERNGFKNLSEDDEEPAMLLRKKDYRPYRDENSRITCRQVSTMEDFRSWIDVVNTALHGWEMIDAEHYFTWVENQYVKIYLAEIDGVAVSTCATIQNGNTASLEFVSTLEQYRRKKAAALLSSYAINDLLDSGAETVTLGACGHSVYLYRGLGFKKYFNNIILKYEL